MDSASGTLQPALGRAVGVGEQVALAGLVGVEQVLRDGLGGRVGRDPAAREALDRERRVRARAGEPGRRAELAQQQPGAGGLGVAVADGGERRGERAAQQRAAQRAAGGGERLGVTVGGGPPGVAQRGAGGGVGRRLVRADPGPQRAAIAARDALGRGRGARPVAEDQLGLGVEEAAAQGLGVLLGRGGGGRRPARRSSPRRRTR